MAITLSTGSAGEVEPSLSVGLGTRPTSLISWCSVRAVHARAGGPSTGGHVAACGPGSGRRDVRRRRFAAAV